MYAWEKKALPKRYQIRNESKISQDLPPTPSIIWLDWNSGSASAVHSAFAPKHSSKQNIHLNPEVEKKKKHRLRKLGILKAMASREPWFFVAH